MGLSNRERQRRFRDQFKTGAKKRVQLALDAEVAEKIEFLIEATGNNQTQLFSRLLHQEWENLGCPVLQDGRIVRLAERHPRQLAHTTETDPEARGKKHIRRGIRLRND